MQIRDPAAFVLPQRCVVCLDPDVTWVRYTQYNAPVITPIVGIARFVRNVSMPYCERHAARLRDRLFGLRASQIVTIGAVVGGAVVGQQVGMSDAYLWVLPAVGVPALAWLLLSLYVIRPRIYDVTYSFSPVGLCLRTKSAAYIDAVMDQNDNGRAGRP